MKLAVANLFGSFGYLFVALQWMWMLVIIGVPIATQPGFQDFFMPSTQPNDAAVTRSEIELSKTSQTIIVAMSVIFSVAIIIYAAIAVPRAAGRGGQKVTHSVASKAMPILTKKKHLSKKRKRSILERINWVIKIILVVLPLAAMIIPPSEIMNLEHAVSVAFAFAVATVAIICFGLQFIVSKLWRLDSRQIW